MAKQFELLRRTRAHSQSRGVMVTLTSVALMLSLAAPTAAVRLAAPDAHALPTSSDIEIVDGNFGLGMGLDSVAIRSFDLDDDEEEFVLFCFRDRVQRILDDGFFVAGFASGARQDASILKILQTDTDCVLAGFPAGTDLGQFSVGGVAPGVVRNVDGEINLPDTIVLDGSSPSFSSGPVLIAVDNLNRTLNRASLVFDENLAETGSDAAGFGYYTRSGIAHRADRIVSVNNDIVVVEWKEADEVEDGVRFFVEEAAIQSRQGFPSFTGSVGGDTSAPDLEDVGRVTAGVWAFRFDEPVTVLDASSFVLYTQNGDRFAGAEAEADDRGTIRVTFDDLASFDEQVIHAATEDGAARGINAGGSPNTIGSVIGDPNGGFDRVGRLGGGLGARGNNDFSRSRAPDSLDRGGARRDSLRRDDAFDRSRSRNDSFDRGQGLGRLDRTFEGATAGPDLIDVDIDDSAGLVGYRFDQDLGDGATFDSERFFLLTPAGELVLGRSIDDSNDDLVVVLFGQALTEDALAAGILDMAVRDEQGNENLARTVDGLGTQGFGLRRNGDRSRGGGAFD